MLWLFVGWPRININEHAFNDAPCARRAHFTREQHNRGPRRGQDCLQVIYRAHVPTLITAISPFGEYNLRETSPHKQLFVNYTYSFLQDNTCNSFYNDEQLDANYRIICLHQEDLCIIL